MPTRVRVLLLSSSLVAAWPAAGEVTSTDKPDQEEVIVTAEKFRSLTQSNSTASRLGLTALETPATVQVITGDAIRELGDADIGSAVTRAAGFTSNRTSGGSGFSFVVRGFSSSSVTALYDGVKSLINIGSMSFPYDTWNIDRIEVLNGPASVLHGNGAIGGAINIIPRKPSLMPSSTVFVSGGSYDTYRAAVDTTGGITEQLDYRVDVSHQQSDGWVARGDSKSTAGTGALSYEASEDLKITLFGDYADRQQVFDNGIPLINGRLDESLREVNYSSVDAEIPFEDQRLHLLAEWQVAEKVEVRSTSYYIHGQRLWHYPGRFTYRPATNDILRDNFGTYLQYQNQIGNHTDLVWRNQIAGLDNALSVGLEATRMKNKRYVDNYTYTDVVDLRNTSPGAFPTDAPITRNYQRIIADQYSAFVEDQLQLTDALSVVGGLRFDRSEVEREDLDDGSSVDQTFQPWSWRLGAVYEIRPKLNVYAQYATATDSVANLCCISAAQLGFALSEGRQTEIGVKQVLWDDRVEWSVAGYRITKNRLLTPDPLNPSQSLQIGAQSSEGVEASVALRLTDAWEVIANGTALSAKYDDFSETVSGIVVSYDGNRPINVPNQSANLIVSWAPTPQWKAQASVRYVGNFYSSNDNVRRMPEFTVIDAGVHWEPTGLMAIDVRVRNAFDKFYAYTSVNNGNQFILGMPRTVELALTAQF